MSVNIISLLEKEIESVKRNEVIDIDYLCIVNGLDPVFSNFTVPYPLS